MSTQKKVAAPSAHRIVNGSASVEDKYRILVSQVKEYAIFMLDEKGSIISWNEGAKRIKGYSEQEIVGKHFSTFYTSEDKQTKKPERELEIAIATGKYEEEGWRLRKDGSQFWAHVVITALFNDQDKLVGFAKVTRDLTERKKAEELQQDLLKSQLELRQHKIIDAQKDEFLSMASHELRTPLTSVHLLTQLSIEHLNNNDEKGARELMDRSLKHIRTLNDLINELLDIAKLNTDRLSLDKKEIDISKLVAEVTGTLRSHHTSHNIEVVKKDPIHIQADQARIEQVLVNLINNAVKYSPIGTNIKVGLVKTENEVTIYVEDEGFGVPLHEQEKIFERYYQVSGTDKAQGLGLGLYISAEIIKLHGGKIGVESNGMKGSRFYFTLPL